MADARQALPLLIIVALVSAAAGYTLAPQQNLQLLNPEFTFTNNPDTIEASGQFHVEGSSVPNATNIFCWFPGSTCEVLVAELVPEGTRSRFKIVQKSLDIIQLSDATLTATASSTDPCQIESLRIDRQGQTASLTVGPSGAPDCGAIPTFTATLGQ